MDGDSSSCNIPIYILSFAAVVLTLVMIWLVWIRKQVEGRFRKFLINLGIIDILLIVSTLLRVSISDGDNSAYFLVITRSLFKYTRWLRFISLAWIVTERVLAVYKPIKYRSTYSHYSICKILISLWLLPLVYTVVAGILNGTAYPRKKNFIVKCAHTLILVIISCLNISLPLGIAKQARVSIALSKQRSETARKIEQTRFNQERKSAILAFFIVGAFTVCNIPVIVAQFWYENTLPVIAASCNITNSRFMKSVSFLVVLDIVFDPIVYFFVQQLSTLRRDKGVRARNLDAACGSKDTSNVKNRNLKAAKDENSVVENAVRSEAFTTNVSRRPSEILSNKARSNEFLTNDIIVHTRGYQDMKDQVPEMIEVEEESKVGDSGGIIECSSCTNTVMKGIELNELPGLCMTDIKEPYIIKEPDLHDNNLYETTAL